MAEIEWYPNTEVTLGQLSVARALPVRSRRMVGPWCFLDRFGPLTFAEGKPMDVAPHPHIGLQTVTWLLGGEILHDDSLGSEAVARPGGVNVMTAGAGIAHTEQTPGKNSGLLDGVQLWVALPDRDRQVSPAFQAVGQVPMAEERGGLIRVFAGAIAGVASPARHYSEILGGGFRGACGVGDGGRVAAGIRAWGAAVERRLFAGGRGTGGGSALLFGSWAWVDGVAEPDG